MRQNKTPLFYKIIENGACLSMRVFSSKEEAEAFAIERVEPILSKDEERMKHANEIISRSGISAAEAGNNLREFCSSLAKTNGVLKLIASDIRMHVTSKAIIEADGGWVWR